LALGLVVGDLLGDEVGEVDGLAVGEVDGDELGDEVGEVDGLALGLVVGDLLGDEVGEADGDELGDEVAAASLARKRVARMEYLKSMLEYLLESEGGRQQG
jgi:uncharacterized protein YcfJ